MTDFNFNTILQELPEPQEMKKRAQLLASLNPYLEDIYERKNGYERYFWQNGAGDEGTVIFKGEDALIFAYDHESPFNHYPSSPEAQTAFNDVPATFSSLLDSDDLKWDWDTDTNKIVYATAAAWFTDETGKWTSSQSSVNELNEAQNDGGFTYAFQNLLLHPFNLQTLTKVFEDHQFGADAYLALGEKLNRTHEYPVFSFMDKNVVILSEGKDRSANYFFTAQKAIISDNLTSTTDYAAVTETTSNEQLAQAAELNIQLVPTSYCY